MFHLNRDLTRFLELLGFQCVVGIQGSIWTVDGGKQYFSNMHGALDCL